MSKAKKRKPTAWMHRLKFERGGGHSEWEFSLTNKSPFGRPGLDHSEEYKVESVPLYRAAKGEFDGTVK